ncbi:MAG: hypothetical protein JRN67_13880 [Nitrososphaerota archaeon]|nr:hypothetical protein [Nitrososphaerota archaeon]
MTKKGKQKVGSMTTLLIDTILPLFRSGSLSVAANGLPVLSLDCSSRSLDVETRGVEQTGLKISQLVGNRGGVAGLLKDSESIAKKVASEGWTLTLYDKGSRALTMGSRVSRLTGHIRVNPLKLRRLLREVL